MPSRPPSRQTASPSNHNLQIPCFGSHLANLNGSVAAKHCCTEAAVSNQGLIAPEAAGTVKLCQSPSSLSRAHKHGICDKAAKQTADEQAGKCSRLLADTLHNVALTWMLLSRHFASGVPYHAVLLSNNCTSGRPLCKDCVYACITHSYMIKQRTEPYTCLLHVDLPQGLRTQKWVWVIFLKHCSFLCCLSVKSPEVMCIIADADKLGAADDKECHRLCPAGPAANKGVNLGSIPTAASSNPAASMLGIPAEPNSCRKEPASADPPPKAVDHNNICAALPGRAAVKAAQPSLPEAAHCAAPAAEAKLQGAATSLLAAAGTQAPRIAQGTSTAVVTSQLCPELDAGSISDTLKQPEV